MSQITEQIAADAKVRRRMEKLLQWSTQLLNQVEYDQGLLWLDAVFGAADLPSGPETIRRKLEGSPAFWTWWKNQWRNLDAQISPNLRAVELTGEWMLCYCPPGHQPTYFSQTALVAWRAYYQVRHTTYMLELRPDEETLRRILKAA